jgi:C_GCAxxG_C_C family probable redox protein
MLAVGGHLIPDLEPRAVCMSTPFGGGIASTRQELCGAFSAGVMVIGALHGRSDLSASDARAYALAKEFRQSFLDRWETVICDPIRDWARSPAGPGTCAAVVSEAALLLLDLLEQA